MPHIKTLPYNHSDPVKPTLRITYHIDGTKTIEDKRVKVPDPELGERFNRMAAQALPILERSISYRKSKGEYDNYDMTRNSYVEEAHKEI